MSINNKKKYYYLLNLKFKFLNYNYLCFVNNYNYTNYGYRYGVNVIKMQSNLLNKLFLNKILFVKSNNVLFYFNDYINWFNFIKEKSFINSYVLCYSGFYINNTYIKYLNNYYSFYNNNYKLFIFIILININNFKYYLYLLIFKIIYILNLKIKN